LSFGKPNRKYLESVIYRHLGAKRSQVIVGPKFGVDNAAVQVGRRLVIVATTDPLSFIPALGAKASAWLSVNLLASDLTTSGFAPQYGVFDFNLPPTMSQATFADYWRSFHKECKNLGMAIVGGHTGRYQGCDYTIIGGGTIWALGKRTRYLDSGMGRPGDKIILTKGAAIETTAVLPRAFPRTVKKSIGSHLFEQALTYLYKVSTVKEALSAVSIGIHHSGVTAMHDATEGGVIAAVLELANASRVGVELILPDIPVSPATDAICKLFGINPLTSLSEGSLIIACKAQRSGRLLARLRRTGINCEVIGRLTRTRTRSAIDSNGTKRTIRYPKFDPYWKAYWRSTRRHWK